MPGLLDLTLRPSYHKGEHDIAADFYLPCLHRAISYDRAVAFFSSSVYLIAWPALAGFVARGGKMRVICSPLLAAEDIGALNEGYEGRDIDNRLVGAIHQMLGDERTRLPTRILAALVRDGVLDVRVAVPNNGTTFRRIFHDKVGIFRDELNYAVVFKGSMNETWSGLASDGNIESIDVFIESIGDRDAERVRDEVKYFEELWVNRYRPCTVLPFPDAVRAELIRAAGGQDLQTLLNELPETGTSCQAPVSRRALRPHQQSAIEAWEGRGRRGILEHATGSGKTETAMSAISTSFEYGEVPIIVVPSDLLLQQWNDALHEYFGDDFVSILRCGGGNALWRDDNRLPVWTRPGRKRRAVLTTLQTAQSDDFRSLVAQGEHIFLIADEVHRLGAPESQRILSLSTGARLGLSATPRRAGDPDGTTAILTYFGGIIPPPYTLQDAIRDGILTPYFYFVRTVPLTDDEQHTWDEITKDIRKLTALGHAQDDPALQNRITQLLIRRARVCKTAQGKRTLALEILSAEYDVGQRWIVYCDNQLQLEQVEADLRENGHDPVVYHSAMAGNRAETLEYFVSRGGIVIAIRCLDEGVDIPSVSHALILASSTNPREFIQRRGRVLRRAPGKSFAVIHDALVVPNQSSDNVGTARIIESELARAIEFGTHAENPSAICELQRLAVRFGIDYTSLLQQGVELDE